MHCFSVQRELTVVLYAEITTSYLCYYVPTADAADTEEFSI